MTLQRAALTFEDALDRVKGLIGYKRVAAIVGVPEGTLSDWSHPGNTRSPPIHIALQLDLAYVDAGGRDRPFLDTLSVLEKTAQGSEIASQLHLAECAAVFVKEAGDLTAVSITASLPGAAPALRNSLRKEAGEAISAAKSLVMAVDALEEAARPPDTS